MFKIDILCVGDFKEQYWKDAKSEYEKRISKFFEIKTTIIKEQGIEKESKILLSKMKGYCILLDVAAKQISSLELAQDLKDLMQTNSKITFVIGGSDGVLDCVKQKADKKISFGKITLPHQLARVVLCEQIYRTATILNNIKYHK